MKKTYLRFHVLRFNDTASIMLVTHFIKNGEDHFLEILRIGRKFGLMRQERHHFYSIGA